jgi:hypothetical protein
MNFLGVLLLSVNGHILTFPGFHVRNKTSVPASFQTSVSGAALSTQVQQIAWLIIQAVESSHNFQL